MDEGIILWYVCTYIPFDELNYKYFKLHANYNFIQMDHLNYKSFEDIQIDRRTDPVIKSAAMLVQLQSLDVTPIAIS